jgi:ATP-dependent protease ClpP protease subunit
MKMPDRMRLGPADAEGTWAETNEIPEAPPYNVIEESIERRRISVYEALDGPERFIDPIHLLRNVEEDDEVHIYLNCPGGDASVRHSLLRIWP